MSNETEKKGNSPVAGKALIFAGIVVIIILLVTVIVLLTTGRKDKKEEATEEKRSVVLTEENVEEVTEDWFAEDYTPPGYFTATMNNVWHFATGDSVSDDAYVANDSGNSNDVYFDIFLEDDEENPIYQSPVIPLGGELDQIKLDKKLGAGSYNCTMIYHLVDENQKTLSTVNVGVTINIDS